MANNAQVYGNGIGLSGAVFLLFLTLQLTGHIDWPWYAVAAPLYAPTVVLIIALVIFAFAAVISLGSWLIGKVRS